MVSRQIVWVLLRGEWNEGGDIVAVFGEKPTDEAVVSVVMPFPGRSWEKVKPTRWESGRDFLSLEMHEVR
jgi:hypothetical protein